MVRGTPWLGALLLLAACSLDSFGMGGANTATPNEDESDGETEAASGTEGDDTSVVDGTGTGPTDDGPPNDDGPTGHPAVIISDGPTFDFGGVGLGTPGEHTFTITNDGDGDASNLVVPELTGAYALASTTCGATLSAGSSCEATVSFTPDRFGTYDGELELSFEDAGNPASASRMVVGRGAGATGNLMVNGDAESGTPGNAPPEGWTIASGNSWATSTDSANSGSASFYPGGQGGVDDYVLYQDREVASLTNWGDAEGVTFTYHVFQRTIDFDDDVSSVRLRFGNMAAEPFFLHQSPEYDGSSWSEASHTEVGPVGTHYLRIELVCHRVTASNCSVYFDDVSVIAEWNG